MTQYDDPRSGDDHAAEASGPVPPPQQEPPPPQQEPPPAQPSSLRGPVLAFVAVAVVVMLAGIAAVGFAIYEVVQPDSGIAACEAIRDSESEEGDDSELTEEEYREVREQFADSAYADIREHGTKLMDVLWQVDQLPEGQEMAALALLGPLAEHATGLQSACADQGVHFSINPN
jgi:hypothetical protein